MSAAERSEDDELDMLGAFSVLRKGWRVIALTMAVFALVAVVAAATLPKKFEAKTILSPVMESPGGGKLGGLSSALGSLGGLASLTGLSGQAGSMRADTLATLKSEVLTERYIRQNKLVEVLLGADGWFGDNKKRTPWAAYVYFDKNVRRITEDTHSGLVTLSIRWKDSGQASKWANELVQLTNQYLRDKAVAESERNIAYLDEQLVKTNVVELRTSIYSLMESEIKNEMLARGSDEYALKVLDPAIPPEKAAFPQPVVLVSAALIIGLFSSCMFLLVRNRLRQT